MSESRILRRKKEKEQSEGIKRRRMDSTVKEGMPAPRRRGRASKKSLFRRSRRKHELVSGRKSSPGRSAESWVSFQVWPNLKWERGLGDKVPDHKMKE